MKKFAATLLSATLALSTGVVFADNGDYNKDVAYENGYYAEENDEADLEMPNFMSVTGEVVEITQLVDQDEKPVYGEYFIKIEGENGPVVFRTNYFTYVLGEEVAVGDTITGYYATKTPDGFLVPMTMIWPPQHEAQLIVNGDFGFEFAIIDRFNVDADLDNQFVAAGNQLILNFNDETQILLQDGQDFRAVIEETDQDLIEALDGRLLVVAYSATTRGIVPMTIPGEDGSGLKIIVLFERAVHLGNGMEDLGEDIAIDWTANEVVVNGEILEGVEWQEHEGAYFVPFRAVVDALGFGDTIVWDGDARTVTVSNGEQEIVLTIGSDVYYVDGEAVELVSAPYIYNDRTYVPFNFFSEVFGLNNAYHFEGQVVINNDDEIME